MFIKTNRWIGVTVLIFSLAILGCAHSKKEMRAELEQKDKQIQELTAANEQKDMEIAGCRKDLDMQVRATQDAEERAAAVSAEMLMMPQEAQPGQCFARVFIPPQFATVSEQVLMEGETEQVQVVPAKYETTEQRIMIREATTKIETIPAQYDMVEEKVLVKEAHTAWQKGRGLIEKVDNTTGEIMCLVEVPAEYKTVKKRVMLTPSTTQVVDVPAEYETVKINKMISPPREEVVKVPAKYETVTKTVMVSPGTVGWRKVLCETNMTKDNIEKIQTALKTLGHDPGPIDGIVGKRTMEAVTSYQKEKGLETGALTYGTIESLQVNLGE